MVKETPKPRKLRKQQHSKRRGLIAFYARRLKEEEDKRLEVEAQAAAAKPAPKMEVTSTTTGAAHILKNNPDLAEWCQSRKTTLRKKKKDAMDRWTMATSGGNFRGK